MIVLADGAFGVDKTTVARELASLLSDGRISDPERIGGTSELVGCWAFEEGGELLHLVGGDVERSGRKPLVAFSHAMLKLLERCIYELELHSRAEGVGALPIALAFLSCPEPPVQDHGCADAQELLDELPLHLLNDVAAPVTRGRFGVIGIEVADPIVRVEADEALRVLKLDGSCGLAGSR